MDQLSLAVGLVAGFVVGSYLMMARAVRAVDDAFDQWEEDHAPKPVRPNPTVDMRGRSIDRPRVRFR